MGAKAAAQAPQWDMRGRRVRWGNVARLGAGAAAVIGLVAVVPSLLGSPEPPPPEPDVGLTFPAEPTPPVKKEDPYEKPEPKESQSKESEPKHPEPGGTAKPPAGPNRHRDHADGGRGGQKQEDDGLPAAAPSPVPPPSSPPAPTPAPAPPPPPSEPAPLGSAAEEEFGL
jgi:hypothetical protein